MKWELHRSDAGQPIIRVTEHRRAQRMCADSGFSTEGAAPVNRAGGLFAERRVWLGQSLNALRRALSQL